jgi:peptidoglycan/LPS O-acetylase OafA/YrhL
MIIVPKYVAVIMSFCGMFAIWILYDAISKGECYSTKGVWKHICGYSFFLYCCHEPALNIFRKFFPEIFGHNNITYLVFYFLNVWIMVTIAIMIAKFLEKRVPKVYHVLSGGR